MENFLSLMSSNNMRTFEYSLNMFGFFNIFRSHAYINLSLQEKNEVSGMSLTKVAIFI